MESQMENRLKNLNRIESLLTELRSTAPAFAVWRPLLQAVIELSAEFKEHVQELRDKELKANSAQGQAQQNGVPENITNGVMPALEPEVSVFDNAHSLRRNTTRNHTVCNEQKQFVNGKSGGCNGIPSEEKDKYKTQNTSPTGKLQITSNIRQLYSIRRRPKMTPSEIVRATATRTRSRSPSPQQLIKAGPWPQTIITTAIIEPEPRPTANGSREIGLKEQNTQSNTKAKNAESAVVENDSDARFKVRTNSKSEEENDGAEASTQENDNNNSSETETLKVKNTVTVSGKDPEKQSAVKSHKVKHKNKSRNNNTESTKVRGGGFIKDKVKGSDAQTLAAEGTPEDKSKDKAKSSDSDTSTERDVVNGCSTKVKVKARGNSKFTDVKTPNDEDERNEAIGRELKDPEATKDEQREKSKETVEDGNDTPTCHTRNVEVDKNKDIKTSKAMNRVSVVLEDIGKSKSKERQKCQDEERNCKSAGSPTSKSLEKCSETQEVANEDAEKERTQSIEASRIKEMEDILANMLKRHKSEDERAKEMETSHFMDTETQDTMKEDVKVKPKTQCRTKAMLLQRLRQSTSLENLSSNTKEPDTSESQSKTDDNLGIKSPRPPLLGDSIWRPAVSVRAFTQPIKDHAFRASKLPAVCSTPITKPDPLKKARARKVETPSKSEANSDIPPTKMFKRLKNHPRKADDADAQKAHRRDQLCDVEVGNGSRVSVTESKAYQDFVQGLYETKTAGKKGTAKLAQMLPSKRSTRVSSSDSDSRKSCTTKSSSTGSDTHTSSERRRRSKRHRTPKYYGPDMFLIDDAIVVNYKVLKPHFEENSAQINKRTKSSDSKRSQDFDLEFLQYEGESNSDPNIKPKKSRNSKHAFTITSARKNTSAYQMKSVEVRLQKMSIGEEGWVQKVSTDEKKHHDAAPDNPLKIPKISLFGKGTSEEHNNKKACDGEEIVGKISSGLDVSTSEDDENTAAATMKHEDTKYSSVPDDVFLTPGSSFHRSNTELDMSKSSLLFEDTDDGENEKENDLNAAKQLMDEEKSKEKSTESKTDNKKGEIWRGRPAELHFRSTVDVSTDLTSDDETSAATKLILPMKRKNVFSTSESESELSTASRSETEFYSNTQHRRKPKHPKKAYVGNPEEQLLSAKYGVIKYGGKVGSKKKEQQVTTDSDSVAGGGNDSTASTITFPLHKDSESDKKARGNDDDDTMVTASDCEIMVAKKSDSTLAITAWNDSVYQTFDKAIDLCLRSNKEAVAMSTDSDPDQESLNLQLDDLDDTLEDIKTPVAKEIKSQSDSNLYKASADERSNFHFFNKDGSLVGRIKRENNQQRRSASSDRILEKGKSRPHVMVNDFSVVIKVMNMLQDFMKEEKPSLDVTTLPVKQQKMLEEICKICHLDVVTDINKNRLVLKNRASSMPSMKDLAKITSW